MTSLQIKYFLTLVQEKSFSKAAAKLFVTQPSFSQFIMKMERELGAKLFDRSCNPIKLTEAGEAYYKASLEISAIESNLSNELFDLTELKCGKLTVGTTPFRASTLLSKSVSAFHNEFGGVDIAIIEGSCEELEESISSGKIDIAICSGSFDETVFHADVLAEETLYIAVSQNNPINLLLEEYRLTYEDIAGNSLKMLKTPYCDIRKFNGQRFVILKQGDNFSDLAEKIFAENKITPKTALKTQNLYTAMSFVLEGLGITIIPDTMIKYGNIKSHPCYYAIDSAYAKNKICLLTKKSRYISKAATEYSKILKQLIQCGTWRI